MTESRFRHYDFAMIHVCMVCVNLQANGEFNDGEDTARRCAEGIERQGWNESKWEWTNVMCFGADEYTGECDCDKSTECDYDGSFSWSACEGCGDTDGGDRFKMGMLMAVGT